MDGVCVWVVCVRVCGGAGGGSLCMWCYCVVQGTLAPVTVSAGFYTGPSLDPLSSRQQSFQVPCPAGSFCVDGLQAVCPAGTFGASAMLSSPACTGRQVMLLACRRRSVCGVRAELPASTG
jgi:hypothetical protein